MTKRYHLVFNCLTQLTYVSVVVVNIHIRSLIQLK